VAILSVAEIPVDALMEDEGLMAEAGLVASSDQEDVLEDPLPDQDTPRASPGEPLAVEYSLQEGEEAGAPFESQSESGANPNSGPAREELQKEADAKGFGQMYAAFGGGRAGLEACAASMSSRVSPV
jgi:hypothetical protein